MALGGAWLEGSTGNAISRTFQVIGETDRRGERPKSRAVGAQNVIGTIYLALGIDPAQKLNDLTGRPTQLLDDGEPITELLTKRPVSHAVEIDRLALANLPVPRGGLRPRNGRRSCEEATLPPRPILCEGEGLRLHLRCVLRLGNPISFLLRGIGATRRG
jgi:hypothetical protein